MQLHNYLLRKMSDSLSFENMLIYMLSSVSQHIYLYLGIFLSPCSVNRYNAHTRFIGTIGTH